MKLFLFFCVTVAAFGLYLLWEYAQYLKRQDEAGSPLDHRFAVRVFKVSDCMWWAGSGSPLEIQRAYMKAAGREYDGDGFMPFAETPERMLKLHYNTSEDDQPADPLKITFRAKLDQMIAAGVQFPCFFATSEW